MQHQPSSIIHHPSSSKDKKHQSCNAMRSIVTCQNLITLLLLLLQQLLNITTAGFVHPIRWHHKTTSILIIKSNGDDSTEWLASRLALDREQVVSMAKKHPPLLNYKIESNLEPTIAFYEDALGGCGEASVFLCESPALLEYNVRKRLKPRLKLVREAMVGKDPVLNASSVKAIATKTDSRFQEWLEALQSGQSLSEIGNDLFYINTTIPEDTVREPSCYMVLSNLQSGGNIGNILRSASIFGCHECLVVGQKRYRLTGEHNARHNLPRRHFYSHVDAKKYLQDKGIRLYGIEIMPNASPLMRYKPETGVVEFPFDTQWNGAAFVMGNEGNGLSIKQREICDEFIVIPQTRGRTDRSGKGSASLNVACAATVVLQAYSTWACYADAELEGEKFTSREI